MEKVRTINDYFKDLVDNKLASDRENFKTIRALLAQVEENIEMPDLIAKVIGYPIEFSFVEFFYGFYLSHLPQT